MQEFTFVDIYGKFDCICSLDKQNYQLIITPKSVKMECQHCHKIYFYRRLTIPTMKTPLLEDVQS